MYADTFNGETHTFKRINFSSATLPVNYQQALDGELVKFQARIKSPVGNKQMLVFLDDFSMPEINDWYDQPTLEIVRQCIETRGLYSLDPDEAG